MSIKSLGTVHGEEFSSEVFERDDKSVFFVADGDIDADGGENVNNDKYWQPTTSLKLKGQNIDALKVAGIVVPGWLPHSVRGIVLGCKARVTNLSTNVSYEGVVHDTGPLNKDGEMTPFMAEKLGLSGNSNTGGTDYPVLLYECWPGIAAPGFDLQPS